MEMETPFHSLLLDYPDFMQEGGARLLETDDGKLALIGIGKVFPEERLPQNMTRLRRIGEIRARTTILELGGDIEISTSRGLKEESLQARQSREKVFLSSFFQVTETRVEGVIRQLPVIGTWFFPNQNIFCVAVGKMIDIPDSHLAPNHDRGLKEQKTPSLLNMEGEEPFLSLLRASPVLCRNGGVRGFFLGSNRKVLIAVGSAKIKDSWVKAKKIARLKAIRSLIGHNHSIELSSVEYLSDQEHLRLSQDGEQRISLSHFLSVQEERVSGIVKALPIVATWEDTSGQILFIAIGKAFGKGKN